MLVPAILGIDPGFATLGWALVDLGKTVDQDVPRALGVLVTEKSSAKKGVLASADNNRRARELVRLLVPLFHEDVRVVVSEGQSWPRNSSASAKVGMAWGVIDTLCELQGLALLEVSPQALKKACCGVGNATKLQVQEALEYRFGGTLLLDLLTRSSIRPSRREHAYDALGAIHAVRHSTEVSLIRSMLP